MRGLLSICKGNVKLPKPHGKVAMHANKEVSPNALCLTLMHVMHIECWRGLASSTDSWYYSFQLSCCGATLRLMTGRNLMMSHVENTCKTLLNVSGLRGQEARA